jgi:hypothetical protein
MTEANGPSRFEPGGPPGAVEMSRLHVQEVLVSHANARLTVHGRALLVRRVRFERQPVAHVAKELSVSRQCAHRWVTRFDAGGWAALVERSSRPHRSPRRNPAAVRGRGCRMAESRPRSVGSISAKWLIVSQSGCPLCYRLLAVMGSLPERTIVALAFEIVTWALGQRPPPACPGEAPTLIMDAWSWSGPYQRVPQPACLSSSRTTARS